MDNAYDRRLALDADGVHVVGWGRGSGVRWVDLVEVDILTTDDGPYGEDVFWILRGDDGSGCVVPGELAQPLLEHLQRLPNFDNAAVCEAMSSTSHAQFRIWRGRGGDGRSAA